MRRKGSMNLKKGASAVLIQYLRERGGSAVVNSAELSRQNGFSHSCISIAARQLARVGILTMEDVEGHNSPRRMTLNEEVIAQLEATGRTALATEPRPYRAKSSGGQARSPFDQKFSDTERALATLRSYQFAPDSLKLVEPLFAIVEQLLIGCRALAVELEALSANNGKLVQAAFGFDANEADVEAAKNVSQKEIDACVADNTAAEIPVLDFGKLLAESAVFKPLAKLQHGARELNSLAVELRLEIAKARLAQQNLQKLIKELQEATVDVSKELHDWQRRSDAVIGRKVRAGIAVVSAK